MASLARPSLWRHRDFVKLWSAATVSVLGSQVTAIALPYIALTMLGASVLEVSALAAVEMLPFLLFTLPAGAWLDRTRRRPVLIAADIGRGVVLLSVPLAYVLDALSLWQLYAVAFAAGTLTAFFDVADQSYLPEILDRDALVDGNANLQISTSVAQMGGPVLGGNLIAIATAPFAIVADALSFFISAGFLSAIRRRDDKPGRRLKADGRPTSIRTDIAEGLRYVLGNRYLRPIAACTGTSNLFSAALFGIFPVLIWDELRLPPAFFGTVVGLASVGFLVGAALSNRLPRVIGLGPTIVISAALSSPAMLLVTLTPAALDWAAVTLFVGWFFIGLTQVVYNVAQVSLRQAITPLDMQSRMNATMRFIVWGTIPIGSLMGGVMASVMPVRSALIIAAVATFASVLPVLISPLRSLREIPREAGTTRGEADTS
ncbi:MAG TPA: MFS transporter [Candidatus Limnocylindrales bacterium]|nr:MFS transporter [Candidatus Limnocylindrales bacterium]